MKCVSIWQPFASLIVHGHKRFETRSWPAPQSIIGERIGIASTKVIRPEQRAMMTDPEWLLYYEDTLGKTLDELPHGCLVGTAVVEDCEIMTEESIDDVTKEEQAFGVWEVGNYAWRLSAPCALFQPVPVQGKQGIWTLTDNDVLLRPLVGENVVPMVRSS